MPCTAKNSPAPQGAGFVKPRRMAGWFRSVGGFTLAVFLFFNYGGLSVFTVDAERVKSKSRATRALMSPRRSVFAFGYAVTRRRGLRGI